MRRAVYIFTFILLYTTTTHGQLMGGWCEDATNMCSSHGQCMDGFMNGTFWCRCDNGYGGDYCERECRLRCDDDKKCVYDAFGNPTCICKDCLNEAYNNAKESCPPGFGGPYCNTRYENPCFPNPCNNGKCYPFNSGYQCICDNGFSGSYCNEGIDHCKNHSCTNGSQCVNTQSGYQCSCPPGRSGPFCEISTCDLLGNMCNHGHCVDIPTAEGKKLEKSFECICEAGYEGEFCTQDKNECLSPVCMNNATCINVAGGFVCDCKPGFTGFICDIPVDMCKGYDCGEGGECLRMPDQTPVCSCKPGFTGAKCEQKCPPGSAGIHCSLPLSKPFCSRDNGPCYNGGKCIFGFCKCPPEYIGDRCEHRREEVDIFNERTKSCEKSSCVNNSTCVDLENGYSCICQPGFDGPNCERLIGCAPTTCANGGICSVQNGDLRCQCPMGFYGKYCEKRHRINCSKNPCMNGGNCLEFGNGNSNGICECVYGFTGIKCQDKLDIVEPKGNLVKELCEQRNCSALASNGVCDKECNYEECGFDGGDCSGGQKPFSKCLYASRCADLFANGVCNQECNNEECLYDGLDCQSELYRCPENIRQHCIERREAMVAAPNPVNGNSGIEGLSKNQILLIALIAFLAFGTVLAGVLVKAGEPDRSRKRRIINAPYWVPPMENSVDQKTSTRSSRCSLLDDCEYMMNPKRVRGDFEMSFDGRYHHIYPTTLTNGVPGAFGGGFHQNNQNIMNTGPMTPPHQAYLPIELPAEQIALHVEAAGPGPITEPLTYESVNQIDSKYRRRVLHWLAGNTNGKPEHMITTETVQCLDVGADVNARDCDENTALMIAVRARRVRLAVVLLQGGANPTIFNNSERSALHEAVINGDVRMVTNLLTDLRLLREIDEMDRNGMTALMYAAKALGDSQVPIATLLLEKGAKIDTDGNARVESEKFHGRTALHYAALADNVPMVQFLVDRNANKDKQDEDGRTPLMLAAKAGREKVVEFLVASGASLTIVDMKDKSAAQLATESYHHGIAEHLTVMAYTRNRNEAMMLMKTQQNDGKRKQTMKSVKRGGSRKAPLVTSSLSSSSGPSSSSRESNHLTPPPSDGSFSSPSPHYFQTTSSTPTGLESSPEYARAAAVADVNNANTRWFGTPQTFSEANAIRHQPTQPPHPTNPTPPDYSDQINGSFYC
ncbi:hypothetical protein CAEBREN_13583 [Caenorhabditis brenneri]|uniref:Uncharacterized protein n=1 Tax=Caenorhabditis brenneri TaxID=135651 RepID=G0NRJ1_CAEBE|nr:hypothetical protein CAEBREN_13583 [Caenorhabditis brenneri]